MEAASYRREVHVDHFSHHSSPPFSSSHYCYQSWLNVTFLPLRCLMAAARSCRTSTHQQTRCTAHRGWRSPRTDTSWWPILATTASKSIATCSSSSLLPHMCTHTRTTAECINPRSSVWRQPAELHSPPPPVIPAWIVLSYHQSSVRTSKNRSCI